MQGMQFSNSVENPLKRPLIIACSGGGGHLSAVECLIAELMQTPNIDLIDHNAQKYKGRKLSLIRCVVTLGVFLQSITWLSKPLRAINQRIGSTNLPHRHLFNAELLKLKNKQQNQGQRKYIDVLLDVYPAGYEFAAVFNAFQVHDDIEDIHNTIQHQKLSDNWHYRRVYSYFLQKLQQAARRGMPYTHILSTQSQAMQAICDAVLTYNQSVKQKINIHQYMTDIPSPGAIHFIKPLNRLNHIQKKRIILMLMCNSEFDLHASQIQSIGSYQNIKMLNPSSNPMVKAGFKNPNLELYIKRDNTLYMSVSQQDGVMRTIAIEPADTVISIMLGALGGLAMVDYLEQIIKNIPTISHVFLFRGDNVEVDRRVQSLLLEYNGTCPKLHILCFQTDVETAPIMARSDAIILRSGGMSTMEHMAIPIKRNKFFFLHHPRETQTKTLTTGLLWEDANADALANFVHAHAANVSKTNPTHIADGLSSMLQSILANQADKSPSRKMAMSDLCET